MKPAQRLFVVALERACTLTHPIAHRHPWLWLPLPPCWLSALSWRLDQRWNTGEWADPKPEGA